MTPKTDEEIESVLAAVTKARLAQFDAIAERHQAKADLERAKAIARAARRAYERAQRAAARIAR